VKLISRSLSFRSHTFHASLFLHLSSYSSLNTSHLSAPSSLSTFFSQPVHLSAPSSLSTFVSQPIHLSAPSAFSPFRFQPLQVSALLLSVPSAFSPFSFQSLHLSAPSSFCRFISRHKNLSRYISHSSHLILICKILISLCPSHFLICISLRAGLLECMFDAANTTLLVSLESFQAWESTDNDEEAGQGVCVTSVKNFIRTISSKTPIG
jgi:hypothetical protein